MSAPTPADLTEADVSLANALGDVKAYHREYDEAPADADQDGDGEGLMDRLKRAADEALELLKDRNESGGTEPPDEWCEHLRGRAESALRTVEGNKPIEEEKKSTQAEQILAIGREAEMFRTPAGDLLAHFTVERHRETWPIASREFRGWLSERFVDRFDKPPQPSAISAALPLLEHGARVRGAEMPDFVRVAEQGGHVYLDLGAPDWSALEISPDGMISQVSAPPVRFRRSRGQLPLPMPQPGGDIKLLQKHIRVASDDDFRLIVGWLIGALMPGGPKPALWLHGRHGSTKSSTTRILRSLVDPHQVPSRDAPREPRDLAISAKRSWVLAYDNLSALPDWLSDAFARLATGAGFGTRELYSDDEEVLFLATRPVIANGIEELAVRGDLLDRAIVIEIPPIKPSERRTEADLDRAFREDAPLILDALLRGVSTALARIDEVHLAQLPRMADFARAVEAAAPAFGWEPGEFLDTYLRSRSKAIDVEIEAAPIGPPLLALMENQDGDEWKGHPDALLEALALRVTERVQGARNWPRSAKALRGALKRLAEALEARGIVVDHSARSGDGTRLLRLSRTSDTSGPESDTSDPQVSAAKGIAERNGSISDTSDTSDPLLLSRTLEQGGEVGSVGTVGNEVSEVSDPTGGGSK